MPKQVRHDASKFVVPGLDRHPELVSGSA